MRGSKKGTGSGGTKRATSVNMSLLRLQSSEGKREIHSISGNSPWQPDDATSQWCEAEALQQTRGSKKGTAHRVESGGRSLPRGEVQKMASCLQVSIRRREDQTSRYLMSMSARSCQARSVRSHPTPLLGMAKTPSPRRDARIKEGRRLQAPSSRRSRTTSKCIVMQ